MNTGARVGIILAALCCLVAWGRLIYVVVAHTPPGETAYLVNRPENTRRVFCNAPYLVEANTLQQFPCGVISNDNTLQNYVGLTDLDNETIQLKWMLSDNLTNRLAGFTRHEDTTVLVVYNIDFSQHEYYLLHADETVETFPEPTDEDSTYMAGVFWFEDRLHVAMHNAETEASTLYTLDETWEAAPAPRPNCDADSLCSLELAYVENGAIHYWYSRVPRAVETGDPVNVEMIRVTEGENPPQTQTLPLIEASDGELIGQYFVNEGLFDWTNNTFDRSRGGVIQSYFSDVPFVFNGAMWETLTIPEGDSYESFGADFQISTSALGSAVFYIEGDHVRWQPIAIARYEASNSDTQLNYIEGRWLAVAFGDDGVFVREIGGTAGNAFMDTRFSSFAANNASGALIRAAEGGYWFYSDYNGAFRLDSSFNRIDAPNLLERIERIFRNFEVFGGSIGDDFFRDEPIVLKRLTFPLVLLFLPVMSALAFGWSHLRHQPLTPLLARVSVLYIGLFALLLSWYWSITQML